MNNKKDYLENIDAYLNNQMSLEEKAMFENLLDQDPLLKSEYFHQQKIVEGIRLSRKIALKNRLNAINLTPFYQTNPFKLGVAATGILMLLGVGIWQYNNNPKQLQHSLKLESASLESVQEFEDYPLVVKTAILENDQKEDDTLIENFKTNETSTVSSNQVSYINRLPNKAEGSNLSLKTESRTNTEKSNSTSNSTIELNNKQFEDQIAIDFAENNKPLAIEDFSTEITEFNEQDHLADLSENEDKGFDSFESVYNNKPVIENINKNLRRFKYQFYNNKLVLHGNFKGAYRLIEVQDDQSSQYYLYYDNKFYSIQENQEKVVPLKAINKNKGVYESLKSRL